MPFDANSPIHRFQHFAMNTTFEVQIPEDREEYARQVSMAIFQEIDRLERLLTRFDPTSDVSQVNLLKPGQSVRVALEVFDCIALAAQLYADTEGAFDIAFQPDRPPTATSPLEWLILGDGAGEEGAADYFVGVSPEARTGDEPFGGLNINLGGIGKGFALDRTREILDDWGIISTLLHSGTSSILAIGSPPGEEGWPVGVGGEHAQLSQMRRVLLRDRALGSSGTEVQGEHIIDPRTGTPAVGHLATWVCAQTAAEADALSTTFMVMSPDEVAAYCSAHPEISALVVVPAATPTVRIFGKWSTR